MWIVNVLGGLSCLKHAQPCRRGQGLEGSGGSERWPSGPWGAGFLTSCLCSPVNNWDLIWEEISKAPVTPAFGQVSLLSLKGDIYPPHVALWRPWAVEVWQQAFSLCVCGMLTFYFSNREIELAHGTLQMTWTQFWKKTKFVLRLIRPTLYPLKHANSGNLSWMNNALTH